MSPRMQPSPPGSRERGQARVRHLTRGAALLAAGTTVAIGIVVAHDHPGASNLHRGANSSGSTASTGGSSSSGTSGNTGSTGNSGNTGNSGSSAPTSSSSAPTVTSGGSAS